MNSDNSSFVASFAKGLSVIRAFGPDNPRMTLTEVAGRTATSRATARRFLLTLVDLGYATSDGKYFELTPLVLTLGQAYLSSLTFWEGARIYLEEVTRQTKESSSIALLDKGEVVYVARSSAPHRILSDAIYVGVRLPAHATSLGQVLLAFGSDQALNAYLASADLVRFTKFTLTTPAEIRSRIHDIRNQGYAIVEQELEVGLISLSLPLRDPAGYTNAAINISAHAGRIGREQMLEHYLPPLQRAADRIGAIVSL
ncbi:MAG: IclR family transcriptional regulator C-terminal domain-containing protein [Alphaproteobacteria bacterium]|nr:IclR family transcriptional regulator C-terminal domain-containing protein [Alphaproteobacteria bacterium]